MGVKCRVNAGTREWWVRNRSVDWTWQDEIDAKSPRDFVEYGEGMTIIDVPEAIWALTVEPLARTNFDVDIKWTDTKRDETKVRPLP